MAAKSFSLSQMAWFRTMADAFAQRGLDPDVILHACGGSTAETHKMDVQQLSDLYSAMWEQAVQRTGDPTLGLTKPSHPLGAFGVFGHMLLSSSTVQTAAQSLARFAALVSPTFAMDIQREPGAVQITFSISGGRRPTPLQRYDFVATVFLSGAQWITGQRLVPQVVHVPFPAPVDARPWRDAYGCPVNFGAQAFRADFLASDFDRPIPTSDPMLADICLRMTEQAAQDAGDGMAGKVRQAIVRILSKGDPRREQVAEVLHVSERTLQRRLSEEGTSFAELVDAMRREVAERLLAQGQLSVTEMAYELGFSDPSNFYRACKRWFGVSPGSLRTPSSAT
mgnify:CR=1 FL=1